MEHYDYHDDGDVGWGALLFLFLSVVAMPVIGFFVKIARWIYTVIAPVLHFFSSVPKLIYAVLLIAAGLFVEYWFIQWGVAQIIAIACTLIIAFFAFIIPAFRLENESCRAQSSFKLWRTRGELSKHIWLIAITELVIFLVAFLVHLHPGSSVYLPGVAATLIVCPILILSVGYLTVLDHYNYA